MIRENTPTTVWNRGYILIFLANLFQHMGQQTITALIPKYASSMGAAASVVGIVSGIFAISALAIRPVASPAFDCFRKRNIYVLATAILLVAYAVFYLAPNVTWLIVGRLLQGVGVGMCAPISLSIACDNLPEGSFAKGVSFFSLGQAFGQAVGPSLGLALSTNYGYKTTFIACFCVVFVCLILAFFVYSKPAPEDARYRIRFDTIVAKEAVPAAITMTFLTIPYACIGGFLLIYANDTLGITNIGLSYTVYAIGILVLRFVTGGLADKFGYRKVLVPTMACFAMTFVMFSVSKSITGFIAAAVFSALGYGIALPNLQALCMTSVPAEKRGVGSNTFFLGQDIGLFMEPYLAGLLADALIRSKNNGTIEGASNAVKASAYSTMYLVIIISLVIAIALVLLNTRKKDK